MNTCSKRITWINPSLPTDSLQIVRRILKHDCETGVVVHTKFQRYMSMNFQFTVSTFQCLFSELQDAAYSVAWMIGWTLITSRLCLILSTFPSPRFYLVFRNTTEKVSWKYFCSLGLFGNFLRYSKVVLQCSFFFKKLTLFGMPSILILLVLQIHFRKRSPYFNYKFASSSRCPNYAGWFRLSGRKKIILLWLKSIRALWPFRSRSAYLDVSLQKCFSEISAG